MYYNEMTEADVGPDIMAKTSRTKVRRLPDRGAYDEKTINAILDEGFICHVGFVDDRGPVVIPTSYARVGAALYLHGAAGNAALRALGSGTDVCVTVTLVDGLVLARSAFHHSINYRSVVVLGTAWEVTGVEEKRNALVAIVDHIVPGRSADARAPDDAEIRATRVIAVRILEASAKLRTGGPVDDAEDLRLPVWAGQIPLRVVADPPVPDPDTAPVIPPPPYATGYRRDSR